ncbi:unnamed protein product [Agarophyton chilense]
MASATPHAPDRLPPPPRFWGPFRPVFGGHTLFEAATSCFLPTFVVFLWRFLFACFLVTILVTYAVMGINVYRFESFGVWVHIGLALSFFLLSMCSFLFLVQKEHPPLSSPLACLSVVLHQMFATSVVFFAAAYWAFLRDYSKHIHMAELVQNAANVAMVLIDLLLALRIQFKLVYCLCFVSFAVTYLIFVWVRFAIINDFVYDFLDYRTHAKGITVAHYLGGLAWAILASFGVFLISRLSRLPCVKDRSTYSKEGSPASHLNRYFAFV